MKRLVIALWCIAAAGLFFPGVVFSGGKGDKGASGAKGTQQGQGAAPARPAETSLQDPEVATIQVSPGIAKETIFRGQLKAEVERMEKSAGRPLSEEEQRQVLDVMINERLAVQAAERDKVSISDNEVNQQVQQLRTAMVQGIGRQPTDAEFAQAVKNETGLELPAFRDQLRKQLTVQKYLQTKKQSLFDSIKIPTEAEILEAFNTAKAEFVRPPTIRFSAIQIAFSADTGAKTKAKETADRLVRQIATDPSKFDDAVARGQSPNAGYQAGEVGYLPKTLEAQQRLGQDFINTAFALKQGQVSKLIEGPQAYNIIKVTESYAQKNLELDDIYRLGTRMTVRDYIGNVMLQKRQQDIIAQASEELITELRAGGKTFQVFDKNLTL